MAEEEEKSLRGWMAIILPRVLRAAFWGFIMGGELLIPLQVFDLGEKMGGVFPQSQMSFTHMVIIFAVIEVIIQLLQGTILVYALSMFRTLISTIALFLITNGGVMTINILSTPETPLPQGSAISFTIDFSNILGIFLIFSLLGIVKNLLQAVDFLSKKAEEPVILPEVP